MKIPYGIHDYKMTLKENYRPAWAGAKRKRHTDEKEQAQKETTDF